MQGLGIRRHRDDTEDVEAALFLFGFRYRRAVSRLTLRVR